MKIVSWNINSVRIRQPFIQKLLQEEVPDVFLLQELKCPEDKFPDQFFPNYNCIVFGQKSYNGVGVLLNSKIEYKLVEKLELAGPGARYLQVELENLTLISVYVPCGGTDFDYKLRFLDALYEKLSSITNSMVIVGGDFNVAVTDIDVQYPEAYREGVLCRPEVRTRMQKIIDLGFIDSVEKPGVFSWWDYRRPFNGLRLDYILTRNISATQKILTGYRRLNLDGKGPSDHAPVTMKVNIPVHC